MPTARNSAGQELWTADTKGVDKSHPSSHRRAGANLALDFVHAGSAATAHMAGGVAFLDYDADGDDDFAVGAPGKCEVSEGSILLRATPRQHTAAA